MSIDEEKSAKDRGFESLDLLVSIIIPLFNEEGIFFKNLEALANHFDVMLGDGKWNFILVDNGSKDSTPQLIKNSIDRWPQSRSVQLGEPNYGLALKAGLTSANTNWVFLFDIEQWDIPFINWAWRNRNKFDIFIGSKRADPTLNFQQPLRRFLSASLNAVLQLYFGFTGSDTHGPKLINLVKLKPIIDTCFLDRGQFDTEVVLKSIRAGKKVVEAPVEYRESRPHRNLIIKKVIWNVLAIYKLTKIMKLVPYEGTIKYYRYSRCDVLESNHQVAL